MEKTSPDLVPVNCPCCNHSNFGNTQSLSNFTTSPEMKMTTSIFSVSVKEIVILLLIFLLLLYSIISFLKSWNKNYRDISNLPYHAICLEDTPHMAAGQLEQKMLKLASVTKILIFSSVPGGWEERQGLRRNDSSISRIVLVSFVALVGTLKTRWSKAYSS